MKIITLDVETTGVPPKGSDYKIDFLKYPRILSIAWKINSDTVKEFIINQEGISIPPEATKINGITDEMASSSSHKLADVLAMILMTGEVDYIVGFNIFFDTSIIKANILRLIEEGIADKITYTALEDFLHKDKRIDIMRICHKLFGGKWPTLSEAYYKLLGKTFNAHSAGSDVETTHEIYFELIKRGLIVHKWDNACVVEEE